jgi:hypothetical protein
MQKLGDVLAEIPKLSAKIPTRGGKNIVELVCDREAVEERTRPGTTAAIGIERST